MHTRTLKRFRSKINVNGPTQEHMPTPCHDWLAGTNTSGYGQFSIKNHARQAHRVAYEITNGAIPEGMLVLHACDRKICVNPTHLRVGSYSDNVADMDRRGRRNPPDTRGESNSQARLTGAEVLTIRAYYPSLTCQSLADTFGVGKTTIRHIIHRRSWKHI